MERKTQAQLRLYFALIKQLKTVEVLKIQLEIKELILKPKPISKTSFRYLLKICDLELRTINVVTPTQQNKIEFTDAYITDLIQHISWLTELCYANNIIPLQDSRYVQI